MDAEEPAVASLAQSDPSRYVEKVCLATGEVLEEPIAPDELLVQSHRDYHVLDVYARYLMGRLVAATGDEDGVREVMRGVRHLGHKAADWVASLTGLDHERVAKALFGLSEREHYFQFKGLALSSAQRAEKIEALRAQAQDRLDRAGGACRVLLTGGTGFVGKEVIWQAVRDPRVAELVLLIRPREIRDRKTGALVETLSPEQRGERLLARLGVEEALDKVRFLGGDTEQPGFGLAADDLDALAGRLTHLVHCAASVAFDAPYDESFRANVLGAINALELSRRLVSAAGSPFVAHVAVETSYIHGRQFRRHAREGRLVFPRNFYNNYYELTKAMSSLETEREMFEEGVPVVHLCPSIVIGEARTGNNRGDTKVVNAPVNVFGRAKEAIDGASGAIHERITAQLLARLACVFPGDASAELNLVPVDRVAAGILAGLGRPQAIGEHVHLATDDRLSAEAIRDTVEAELGAVIHFAEPTIHRTVGLPVLSKALQTLGQERLADVLEKLGTIFGGYSEWGQPIHDVGNDVRLLGLPAERPATAHAFRMLCRHNRYVQDFGRVKDPDEVARRERVWTAFVDAVEAEVGAPAGSLPAEAFRAQLAKLDLDRFVLKDPAQG
jgi:nucleoside-diphosphate-sugar epimerase